MDLHVLLLEVPSPIMIKEPMNVLYYTRVPANHSDSSLAGSGVWKT